MPRILDRLRAAAVKNLLIERAGHAVAVRVEQFAVIGSPETGDSGGDEQAGGDGDRDAQRQQRGRKLGRGVQRRHGCQERRDGRHAISLASSEERRVGKECLTTCSSRWSPYHAKKQTKNT